MSAEIYWEIGTYVKVRSKDKCDLSPDIWRLYTNKTFIVAKNPSSWFEEHVCIRNEKGNYVEATIKNFYKVFPIEIEFEDCP